MSRWVLLVRSVAVRYTGPLTLLIVWAMLVGLLADNPSPGR
ncbi:MAG: hypothetical protein NTY19_23325 [Planctomycetota bacterium]|nr:hypothetical protein [Planctomycetota bacterium]